MRTPICETLGIEFPLFAFSHCRDVVAAVTNAGGFGVLGALTFTPEQLEEELTWIDAHTGGRPYGVDIVIPAKYVGREAGEWNSLEIDCLGARYRIIHNGVKIVEADVEEYPALKERLVKGFLGLQNHSEAVWYRNIRIQQLGVDDKATR